MSTATRKNIDNALLLTGTAGGSIRQGAPLKLSAGNLVEATAVNDVVVGIAYAIETVNQAWPAASTNVVQYAALGADAVVPVLVGTGGVTAGSAVKVNASTGGATNVATLGGVTTALTVLGLAVDTGAAGELVGVNLGLAAFTVGT